MTTVQNTQTSDTPLVDHYTAADEVATLTPLTDAVRFRLHASFCDWPEEAQEAIELYDDFARSLERSLAKANADREVLRWALAKWPCHCDDFGPCTPCAVLKPWEAK
jgi:hypothetical protein